MESFKQRRPIYALLLSVLAAGLGQLYNGQTRRALVFLGLSVSLILITYAALALTLSDPSVNFVIVHVAFVTGLGVWIFNIFDALLGARRIREVELKRYNRWYIYLAFFLFQAAILEFFGPARLMAPYSIPSGSMIPTLVVGDSIYAAKNAYTDQPPERGEIVVFRQPPGNRDVFIKRIVGIPGDRIQMIGGVLHINGKAVEKRRIEDFVPTRRFGHRQRIPQYIETLPNGPSYTVRESLGDRGPVDSTREFVLQTGDYFVMGDNRDDSNDSRSWGFVPAGNLKDKLLSIGWSNDFARIGTTFN